MAKTWVVNASPSITLAKIGQLELLRPPGITLDIPSAMVAEIMSGDDNGPAKQTLQSGWGGSPLATEIEQTVIEWGLGAGETAVLSRARHLGSIAVPDDLAARTAAKVLGISLLGTLGVVLRARK